jgi:hypothetical protein
MQVRSDTPFILRFKRKVETPWLDVLGEPGVHFDEDRMLWVDATGAPLWAGRMKKYPTACSTAGKMIPAGYTPSGKYKPSTYRPPKMDKRSGK